MPYRHPRQEPVHSARPGPPARPLPEQEPPEPAHHQATQPQPTEGCGPTNFSSAGDGVADTAPDAPIPDAKPDWKLLAALDNGLGLLANGLLLNASDIDDAGAVAASFNEPPLNALKPDGTCGGRIEPTPSH